jgi:ADP-L-glycero-D-manno-heptose 6-epimerase
VKRVLVTGGAGFIGSALVWKLNREGIEDILVVDSLDSTEKWQNLVPLRYTDYLHKDVFIRQIRENSVAYHPDAVVHLGACSSTTERNADYLMENNFHYTRHLAEWAHYRGIRFVYASSAATYGDGSLGFSDDESVAVTLQPLNMYGYSKSLFDLYAIRNRLTDRIAGVKFFNVFGPNEYHKADMISMVLRAFRQVRDTGSIRLFESNHPDYPHGGQKRDFVYVKDCVDVLWWLLQNHAANGIFNLGTGEARTWNALATAVFAALDLQPSIEYIPMPENLKGKYQYFTEAQMERLRAAGYTAEFRSLENSVRDYVAGYLKPGERYLGSENAVV